MLLQGVNLLNSIWNYTDRQGVWEGWGVRCWWFGASKRQETPRGHRVGLRLRWAGRGLWIQGWEQGGKRKGEVGWSAWWERSIESVGWSREVYDNANKKASQVTLVKNPPAIAGDLRDTILIPGLGRSPGGGRDNPLQYSCLEIPMGRGDWQRTVHGVAKNQTQMKGLSTHAWMPTRWEHTE